MKKIRILLAVIITAVLLSSVLFISEAEPAADENWQADLLKLMDPADVPSTTQIDYENTYEEGVQADTHDIACEITVNGITYGCEFIFEVVGEAVNDWSPVQDWLGHIVTAAASSAGSDSESLAKAIDKAIFPGTQGGPLMHIIAAKAVCFGEALRPEFAEYGKKIVANAKVLERELTARGVKLVSGGTDNHLLLLDLRGTGVTGKELEHRLDAVNITAKKNTVPNEPESPFVTSGVRIGTPAVTTRGFGEAEMVEIARWIAECIFDFEASRERIAAEVEALTARFPLYE
jgi:hypothetical protein